MIPVTFARRCLGASIRNPKLNYTGVLGEAVELARRTGAAGSRRILGGMGDLLMIGVMGDLLMMGGMHLC